MRQDLEPILLLREYEQRCKATARGLPKQIEVKRTWDGIGFRVGQHKLVSALGDVHEILPYPELTRVPGTKPWVKGIANIRGNLLTVLDLRGFLFGDNVRLGRNERVLVMQNAGVTAGVLVDEVLGLRHFTEEEATREEHELGERLSSFLAGTYREESGLWGVFSMLSLVENAEFMQVAA